MCVGPLAPKTPSLPPPPAVEPMTAAPEPPKDTDEGVRDARATERKRAVLAGGIRPISNVGNARATYLGSRDTNRRRKSILGE